jgi:pentapeptide MXKDX repeat protein
MENTIMTLRILALALAATLTLGGVAAAQDAMSAPMAPADAMAPNSMAGDAMAPMDADQMLADCLVKAGTEMDAMKKDEATKACHDEHNAMGTDAMAPAADAMAGDAMAPATK